MSKSKINPLITASVMSAVCMAGFSQTSHAVVIDDSVTDLNSTVEAVLVDNNSVPSPANAIGQRRYIIQLNGAAVARFTGNSQFSPIPRLAGDKIDVNDPSVRAYASHLTEQQNNLLASMSNLLGRQLDALLNFQYAYNGMAVYLSATEAESVANVAGVKRVILDRDYVLQTDAGPQLIGADNLWGVSGAPVSDLIFKSGFETEADGAFGENVVIGILDSGANFDHPSFAEVGGDGFVHTNPLGSGNFLGACDPGNLDQYLPDYTCNNKTIGGFDFVNGLEPPDGFDIVGPEDENGHGSHTASTAGGNMLAGVEAAGVAGINISGVAPHATLVIFDVCYNNAAGNGLCPGVSSIASIDQAISDGLVDVVNFSIGGGVSPWTDPVSEAFLNATASGIFVAASAGNSGPGPGTLGHVEPWTASSGASTHNRRFSNDLTVTGPMPVAPELMNALAIQGTGPVMVTDMTGTMQYSGIVDGANVEGCVAFPASSFDGLIAVISRGACSFADKVNNAVAAGATGVIVHNNVPGDPIVMGGLETTTVSSVMVSLPIGMSVVNHITANPGTATVSVSATTTSNLNGLADSMAGFSSRGPSPFEYNKPDVTGPGVSILAAFDDDDPVSTGTPAEYGIISGTSMSSPHNAGAAALLKGLRPGWSAPEIKSALMMTAITDGVTKEDGLTPADPFDRGAGRIQVDVAAQAGLVMDETALNFFLADPANGGDPKTLNVPSITDYNCVETCSFQRGFRSVATGTVTYNASLVDITGTVTPSTFTLNPGQFVVLNVEVQGDALPAAATSFGELVIEEDSDIVFGVSTNTAIPDDAYDGTLATMACDTINVAGLDPLIGNGTLETAITHSWVGDLTIKLQNPDGDVLGVMSRPDFVEPLDDGTGCCGSNSNLAAADPISFFDGAAVSAEAMPAGFADINICTDDGICEYSPAPGAVAQPPATMAEMFVADPNGDWMVCVGDSGGGDTGDLVASSLIFAGESSVPSLHLPMVVVGFPAAPEITVTPALLTQAQAPDTSNDLLVNIANEPTAGADLNWTIATTGSVPDPDVIFSQNDPAITNGIVSDFFGDTDNSGVYSADDFTLASEANVGVMSFNGFTGDGTGVLADQATAVTVLIYNDVTNLPEGQPQDGNNLEVFNLTLNIGDAALDTTDSIITIDVVEALGNPLNLSAGTYWVTVFPILPDALADATRWNWFASGTSNGTNAQLIDPNDLFAAGFTDWTDLTGVDPVFSGLSFTLSGALTCGASWMSFDATTGTVTPGDSDDVTVTLDSTGLAPGEYKAAVCIDSNDADEAQTVVPVTLTVNAP